MKRFYSLELVVISKDEQILPYLKLFRYLEILFSVLCSVGPGFTTLQLQKSRSLFNITL